MSKDFILKGDICFSESLTNMCTFKDSYVVCVDGRSKGVFNKIPSQYSNLQVYDYSNQLIIPGLVDLHIHAPQYPFIGMGMDMELMDWLQNYTYPEEMKYADIDYANKAYNVFAEKIKKSATTHACIFATTHVDATNILMDYMEKTGICSYVGKVNMDREAPIELCDVDAKDSCMKTGQWLKDIAGQYHNTKPILTPRFVPCCTQELLSELGNIQREYNIPVQSHLSENPIEIEFVLKDSPNIKFYGEAYNRHGLFGKNYENGQDVKTIMAHCVYSSDDEVSLLKENKVFVAHCPSSNMNLASGIAPIRHYLEEGINVGLGSDVAGGHTESMFSVICNTIQVSKLYWRLVDSNLSPLTYKEAFYLATKGGGKFFGNVGSFEMDYDFNAVVLDDSILNYSKELSIEERLESATYQSLDLYGIVAKFGVGGIVWQKELIKKQN